MADRELTWLERVLQLDPSLERVPTPRYVRRVGRALDEALARARGYAPGGTKRWLEMGSDRYIFFSDAHRGARNRADDFRNSESAYNAALAYYYRLGHTLVVIGDMEELWEEPPEPVIEAYTHTLDLEARFHHDRRYIRIWGNHDDMWQYEEEVEEHLAPLYEPPDLNVHESLIIDVRDDGKKLGELFIIHGQQGDMTADQWSWVFRHFVRYVWRPIQRLTGISRNTPAVSWSLTHRLNQAMYAWVVQQPGLVLFAGHTHEPAFKSQSLEAQLEADLERMRRERDGKPTPEQRRAEALILAELEWVRAQSRDKPKGAFGIDKTVPCFFNTGCACYPDGSITGIEITDGEIRLVRWPTEEEEPEPEILARDSLRDVFAAL
jgi:hypothetical protein